MRCTRDVFKDHQRDEHLLASGSEYCVADCLYVNNLGVAFGGVPRGSRLMTVPRWSRAGGPQVVTPDVPFSVDDLASDHVFYVQEAPARRDVFSFYVSDGQSQTEAFDVEIHIQVRRLLRKPGEAGQERKTRGSFFY